MSNIKNEVQRVKYPKEEKFVAFLPNNGMPFHSAIIGITYPNPDYRISRAPGHNINVFEFVLEGEGEIYLDGMWKKVKAGDTYVLRGGEEHQYRANPCAPWKKQWINYIADYIAPLMDAYGVQSGIYKCPEAQKYFDLATEAAKFTAPNAELCQTVAECVHKIIYRLSSSHTRSAQTEEISSDAYRIREELTAALYKKLDLDELTQKLHISKSNIIRIFKKRYGTTPYEYLLNTKIETAKVLLLNTQIPVKEIANRLCISDEHYFSSLFYARVGVRPRQFRKNAFGNTETE